MHGMSGQQKRAMLARLLTERSGPGHSAPLSFAQERLWFLEQLQPGNTAYHLPMTLTLAEDCDADALRRALDALVERHESLRTVFGMLGGAPVQRVEPPAPVPLPETDLRSAPDPDPALLRAIEADNALPFDLQRGPLLRAQLFRMRGRSVLLLNMHHIVSDGWSCDVIRRELIALCEACAEGRPSPLPPLPLQYADFAAWQREALQGEGFERALAYWARALDDAPVLLDLPCDRPRPAMEDFRGAYRSLRISAPLVRRLRALARARNATLFMVMLAVFQALLARLSGSEDVIVGSPTANRDRPELEALVGFFVNMLPLRARPRRRMRIAELIDAVRANALEAFAHQALPFEKLVDRLQVRRSLGHNPLFQVAFVLQSGDGSAETGDGHAADDRHAISEAAPCPAKFDLTLSLAADGEALTGTCEYRSGLFDDATVGRWMQAYLHWLECACAHPDAPLSALELPSAPTAAMAATPPAHRLAGLDRDSRLAAADPALRPLAQTLAQAAGARVVGMDDAPFTHLLTTPETLATLASEAVPGDATLLLIGLPCFDVAQQRWRDRRRVGFWADGPRPLALLDLDAPEARIAAALPGERILVLDVDGREQATGLHGEIALGANARRTGIAGRRRDDGGIEWLGPLADQVRIDGQRVDPGRLRALLAQHPAVAAADVRALGDTPRERALHAAVVARGGRRLAAGDLQPVVAARLPAALVPRRIVRVERLDEAWAAPARTDAGARARTPLEAVLGRIWCEVLKHPQIDPDANFFDLGGNSITSVQAIARIRETLRVELPLHRLFETPTIAELARSIAQEYLAQAHEDASATDAAGDDAPQAATPAQELADDRIRRAPPGPRRSRAPLSYAQERLWFLDQLAPGSTAYHMALEIPLDAAIDPRAVQRAVSDAVARHEALRTAFPALGGLPQQAIAPPAPVPMPLSDLRALAPQEREREAARLLAEAAERPFDLSVGPLLRARHVRIDDRRALLSLVVHHIVFDGWSLNVLLRELRASIAAYAEGRPATLPEPPVQYADFARWQRRQVEDEAFRPHLEHWRQTLAGAPTTLALPLDRPRPAVERHRGAQQWFAVDAAVTDAARILARAQGTTLYCVLLAAFSTLLMRLSGQEDLLIGTPVANRTRVELEGVIGFFANTLVLRNRLDGNPAFAALLERTRAMHLAATEHQDVPFEKLVELVRPERRLNHNPLFQVMLVLQNTPDADPLLAESAETWLRAHGGGDPLDTVVRGTAKFDLTMTLIETPAGLAGNLEYDSDLFDDVTIALWLRLFGRLLAAATAAPATPLWSLPLLDAAEAAVAIRPAAAVAEGPGLLPRILEHVRRTPDAPAIVDCARPDGAPRIVDYAALDRRSRALAARLRAAGAGPGDRIALSLPRGADALIAVLAIVRLGAVAVPIDPAYPAARRALMLADADPRAIVVARADAATLAAAVARPAIVPEAADETMPDSGTGAETGAETDAGTDADDDVVPDREAPLYMLYTSGSTGRPKGVLMPQRALCDLVAWQLARTPELARATTLQFSSLSFDVSLQELFLAWCGGACLVAIDEAARADPVALLRTLREQRVERLFMPYVALQQLAEAARHVAALPPLREIVTAGEQLRVTPAIVSLFERLGDCRLRNQYGPTETHVVTDHALVGAPSAWPTLPPIGIPIDGAAVYVLDRHRRPVPPGVIGELYLGGNGVALGYFGRPELDAERFFPDPFRDDGGRMYRSGDLGRVDRDGVLWFAGRADQQLKIRGYRIEPGEIEAALVRIGAEDAAMRIDEAVVVAWGSEADDKRLVAYLLNADGRGDVAAVRRRLAAELPEPLVPSSLNFVSSLPTTPSGKLDRAAIARLPPADIGGDDALAPATPLERMLAEQFGELLGLERVPADADFFALGGHSLLATRLRSRIANALGLHLPVRQLFETPDVRGLASVIVDALARRIDPERADALLRRLERGTMAVDADRAAIVAAGA